MTLRLPTGASVIIAVASGKGGTGKTTVATSLALALAVDTLVLFLDCDVEAPNAHLLLKPALTPFGEATLPQPQIAEVLCDQCGIALVEKQVLVFPELCHGCGSCTLNCPKGAISEVSHTLGLLENGFTAEGIQFARGVLHIGQPLAVPVIRQLKHAFPTLSQETVIIDAPPGTSCPVVEAIRGADFVLLVTEPTPFGLHDLKLAYELTRELGLSAGVIINRDGIGDHRVEDFCAERELPVLLRIPMDREVARGIAQGIPLVRLKPEYGPQFRQVFVNATAQV